MPVEGSTDYLLAESSTAAVARASALQNNHLLRLARNDPEKLDHQREELIASSRAHSVDDNHASAIDAASEAVEIACALVFVDKAAFRIALGQSLLALANRLLAASDPEEALPFVQDAVEVGQLIQRHDPSDQALLQIVMALDQLGRAHSTLGDFGAAITAVSEATKLLGALCKRTTNLLPDYSTLLQTQSMYCLQAGRAEDAVKVAEHATKVARRCIQGLNPNKEPHQFVRFAIALNQLSNAHEAANQLEKAFDSTEEAFMTTRLVNSSKWPNALVTYDLFFTGVGNRLWMLYQSLPASSITVHRLRVASDTTSDVLALYRATPGRRKNEGLQVQYAEALTSHAEALSERKKPLSALKSLAEATEVYATLAKRSPMEYLDTYATSLLRQVELSSKHKWRGAADYVERCVLACRQISRIDADRKITLALALAFQGDYLASLGKKSRLGAIKANDEAVQLFIALISSLPSGSGERKVAIQTLYQCGRLFYKLRKLDEAGDTYQKLRAFLEGDNSLKPRGYHLGRCLLEQARLEMAKMQDAEAAKTLAEKALVKFREVLEGGYGRAMMYGVQASRIRAIAFRVQGMMMEADILRQYVIRMWLGMMPRRMKPVSTMRGLNGTLARAEKKSAARKAAGAKPRMRVKSSAKFSGDDAYEFERDAPASLDSDEMPLGAFRRPDAQVERPTPARPPPTTQPKSIRPLPLLRPDVVRTIQPLKAAAQAPTSGLTARSARADALKARLSASAKARAAVAAAFPMLQHKQALRPGLTARSGNRSLPRF
ncbi:hypothetical protein BKA62DRAFT_685814 [Auriculariales sp. MPI-PUGE-AT-0066]|nr:hypothetical protein BKA62DRAFT_685814 [Auriculariales sp. MPI-PUGE-AT-0066]